MNAGRAPFERFLVFLMFLLTASMAFPQGATLSPGVKACRALPGTDAPMTLFEVVDRALCANPQTRIGWAEVEYQTAQLGVARAPLYPLADLRLQRSRWESAGMTLQQRTASLNASWLLFDGGHTKAAIEGSAQRLAMALASQDAAIQQLLHDTVLAFHTQRASEAVVAAAVESEKAATESLAATELRHRLGLATPADKLQAATAHAQARLAVIRAQGQWRIAQASLSSLLAFPPGSVLHLPSVPVDMPDDEVVGGVNELLTEAEKAHPSLAEARANLSAAEADVAAARSSQAPTLSLGVTPVWQRQGEIENRSSTVGLTLAVPLFSGFETQYRIDAARARRSAAEAALSQQQNQLALAIWQQHTLWVTARDAVSAAGEVLQSAEAAANVALGRYRAGVGSVIELLSAQAALATARQQRIQARVDWEGARIRLALAIGKLRRDNPLLQEP